MNSSFSALSDRLQVPMVLEKYWRLRVGPTDGKVFVVVGDLEFRTTLQNEIVEETFEVKICIPNNFPRELPWVFETGGRIPNDFHKLKNGSLCLGAPTDIWGRVLDDPTLSCLIEQIIIPYLASFVWHTKYGTMPFGELDHGGKGLLQHFCNLYNTKDSSVALQFVFLSSLRRRFANQYQCPCGRKRRLGRCHNFLVNGVRDKYGRKWFQNQYLMLTQL